MLPGNQSGNDWAFPGAEGTLRGGPNIARRGIFGPGRPPRPSAGAAFQGYRGGAIQRGTRRSATALPSAPADGPSVIITSSRSSVLGNAPERSGERESERRCDVGPNPPGRSGVLAVAPLPCTDHDLHERRPRRSRLTGHVENRTIRWGCRRCRLGLLHSWIHLSGDQVSPFRIKIRSLTAFLLPANSLARRSE